MKMADVLDLYNAEDFEADVESDRGLARVKKRAKRKKGRGFNSYASSREDDFSCSETSSVTQTEDPNPQRSVEGWILFVSSIHEEAQEDDLHETFSEFGDIKNIHLNLDRRTGFLKGYALVEFETFKEASRAKEELDGSEILGQKITVEWCFVKEPKKLQGTMNEWKKMKQTAKKQHSMKASTCEL